jgi:hypothetical protein
MNVIELGTQRQKAHPFGTPRYYSDENLEDIIGLAGEVAFAKRYGLKPDLTIRPEGDKNIDFKIEIDGTRIATIDVKTAQKAFNLLVKEWEIQKCSDVLVLCEYFKNESIMFVGWATRKMMQGQPIKIFSSLNIPNHYLHRSKLKPMSELDAVFKKHKIRQIFQ